MRPKNILKIALTALFVGSLVLSTRSAAAFTLTKDLSIGSTGPDVVQLQNFLIGAGFNIPSITSGGTPRGNFGQKTANAVMSFQKSVGLKPTGYVGQLTRDKIAAYVGSSTVLDQSQPAPFGIVYPNGGDDIKRGATINIRWNAPTFIRATYVDINLVPAAKDCPDGYVCEANSSYVIARDVSIDTHMYSWHVGDVLDATIPPVDGAYYIQVCQTGLMPVCVKSDQVFSISSNKINRAPVVDSIDAPAELAVGQQGSWLVHATDAYDSTIEYSVSWGDDSAFVIPAPLRSAAASSAPSAQQYSTGTVFTHTFAKAGAYTVTVTARNSYGLTSQASTMVVVK